MKENDRLSRLEAYVEISNLMGKYVFHRMNQKLEAVVALFSNREDLWIEMPSGIYRGTDAAKRCFEIDHPIEEAPPYSLVIHDICTPVIEVAGDCETARGVWISPGIATATMPEGAKGLWAWVKYDCDFIREDAGWKIWHMRKYEIFTVPTDRDWTEENPMGALPKNSEEKPTPPPKMRHNDMPSGVSTKFSLNKKAPALPEPPNPYTTWKEQET